MIALGAVEDARHALAEGLHFLGAGHDPDRRDKGHPLSHALREAL